MNTRRVNTRGWMLAAIVLLLPSVIFLLAVLVQTFHDATSFASTAHDIVMAFAGKRWALWGPLVLEPFLAILCCTIGLRQATVAGLAPPPSLQGLRILALLVLAIVAVHVAAT